MYLGKNIKIERNSTGQEFYATYLATIYAAEQALLSNVILCRNNGDNCKSSAAIKHDICGEILSWG